MKNKMSDQITCSACKRSFDPISITCPHCGHARWGTINAYYIIALISAGTFFFLAPRIESGFGRITLQVITAILGVFFLTMAVYFTFKGFRSRVQGIVPEEPVQMQSKESTKMVHCQKCKTRNPPAQATCSNCGADLLPAEGIGSRLSTFIAGIIVMLIPAIPAYFIFRPETPHPILKWIGYFLIAAAVSIFGYFTYMTLRKTPIHERYAIRARRHIKLDTQQTLADFAKALDLAPQTERPPFLKERAAIYGNLGMKQELESDWNEILDIKPANERIRTLRERAVVYEKLEIVQNFRSAREEILTKMKPHDRTQVTCKLSGVPIQIPYICVYCGCPIETKSEATISTSTGNSKGFVSFKFPLCSECDEARTSEVDSAVKLSNYTQMHAFSDGRVTFNFLNPIYAKEFLSANS